MTAAPPEEIARVVTLYQSGQSYAQMGEATGLSFHQLRRRLEAARLAGPRDRPKAGRPQSRTVDGLTLGQLMRHDREAHGFTVPQLATAISCDRSFINHTEADRRTPSARYLERIAAALGLGPLEYGRWLVAAGYAPDTLTDWGPAHQAVAQVWEALTPEQRAAFARQVGQLCDWWLRAGRDD